MYTPDGHMYVLATRFAYADRAAPLLLGWRDAAILLGFDLRRLHVLTPALTFFANKDAIVA